MPSKTDPVDDMAGEPPTDIDPYKILALKHDATEDDVKKAYRRAALKNHPDKVPDADKEAAKVAFQQIAFAYAVLSDARRRRRYDNTGSTADVLDLDDDDDFDWLSFFREQWEAVTPERIAQDKLEYIDSGEQAAALLAAYTRFKGDMGKIYEVVMHSNVLEDDARLRGIIDAAISSGAVESYDKYTKETDKSKAARIKTAQRHAREFEQQAKDAADAGKGGKAKAKGKAAGGDGDLAALIQQRQQGRQANFLDTLEQKYGGKPGKGKTAKGKREVDEPPESAFAATAARKRAKAGP